MKLSLAFGKKTKKIITWLAILILDVFIGTMISTTTAPVPQLTIPLSPNYYNEYQQALQQNQQLRNRLTTAKEPPYILMEERTVTAAFKKTDGTTILWK